MITYIILGICYLFFQVVDQNCTHFTCIQKFGLQGWIMLGSATVGSFLGMTSVLDIKTISAETLPKVPEKWCCWWWNCWSTFPASSALLGHSSFPLAACSHPTRAAPFSLACSGGPVSGVVLQTRSQNEPDRGAERCGGSTASFHQSGFMGHDLQKQNGQPLKGEDWGLAATSSSPPEEMTSPLKQTSVSTERIKVK